MDDNLYQTKQGIWTKLNIECGLYASYDVVQQIDDFTSEWNCSETLYLSNLAYDPFSQNLKYPAEELKDYKFTKTIIFKGTSRDPSAVTTGDYPLLPKPCLVLEVAPCDCKSEVVGNRVAHQ